MLINERICRECGKAFKPEFGRQIFCSVECRKANSNSKRRAQRNLETNLHDRQAIIEILSKRAFLSIKEAALFLGVSRPTIYRRIGYGEYHPIKVSSKTVRIPIQEVIASSDMEIDKKIGDFSLVLNLQEALLRYDTTRTKFYEIITANNIAVRKRRGIAYYPQKTLDQFLPLRSEFKPDEWYTINEVMKSSGYSRSTIRNICLKANIPKVKKDGTLYISKRWDNHRYTKEDLEKNYMTHKQAVLHYRIGNDKFYNFVNESGIPKHRDGNLIYFKKSDLDKLFKKK